MRNVRLQRTLGLATGLPLWILGGCISGPQFEDFLITEFARVLSDIAGQVFGAFLTSALAT